MSDKTGKQGAAAPSSSAAALLNQPIVLDTGTGTTRAGFAGGTKPKVRVCVHLIPSIPVQRQMFGTSTYIIMRFALQLTHSSLLNLQPNILELIFRWSSVPR